MKKSFILQALIITGLILALSLKAENIISNSGFEQGVRDWFGVSADCIDLTEKHTGNSSLKFLESSKSIIRQINLNQTTSQPIRISVWNKTDNAKSKDKKYEFGVGVGITYADGSYSGVGMPFRHGTHDWEKTEVELNFPKAIKTIVIYIHFSNMSGYAWVDDLEMKYANASTKTPGNLLNNPSFHTATKGWAFYNASVDMQTGIPGEIQNSGKMSLSKKNDRALIHQDILLDRKDIVPLVYSAWSKAEGIEAGKTAVGYIVLFYQDGTEDWIAPRLKFSGLSDWEKKEAFYTPKKPVKKIRFYFDFSNIGNVWIDDVFISEVEKTAKIYGPCKFTDNQGNLILENDFVKLILDPAQGGTCKSLVNKKSNASLSGKTIDFRMFTDRIRELPRPALYQSTFGYRVLRNSDETASIELSLFPLPGFPFITYKKTFDIQRNSPAIRVTYELKNESESMAPIILTPYFRSGVTVQNEQNTISVPTENGIVNRTNTSGGEPVYKNAVQGWIATTGSSGNGIACEYDFSRLDQISCWLGGINQTTIEWNFSSLKINNGESFKTAVNWLPYSSMSAVDNVENGIVGAFTEMDGKRGCELFSTVSVMMELQAEANYSDGGKATETHTLYFNAGRKKNVHFNFATGKNIESIKVILVQKGNICFEMVKYNNDSNRKISPRTAKVAPIDIPAANLILTNEVETPHTKWSTPYSKGPVKALILTDLTQGREIIELAQRMDIVPETVRFADTGAKMGLFLAENYLSFSFSDANRSLGSALKHNYDILIVSGGMWKHFSAENIKQIERKLKAGMGLILISPYSLPKEILAMTPLKSNLPNGFIRINGKQIEPQNDFCEFPFSAWPEFTLARYSFLPNAHTIIKANNMPLLVKGAGNCYIFTYQCQGALVPEVPLNVEMPEWNYPDYQMQPLIYAILDSVGKFPDLKIRNLKISGNKLNFKLQNFRQGLSAQIRSTNLLSGKKTQIQIAIKEAQNSILLPQPLEPGINIQDIILYSGKKVVDFAGCSENVKGPCSIKVFQLNNANVLHKKEGLLQGRVEKFGQGEVRLSLIDGWNRVIAEKTINGNDFSIAIPEASSVKMSLRAEAWNNNVISDRKEKSVYVEKKHDYNDYSLAFSDHGWAFGRNRFFQKYGFYPQTREMGFNQFLLWAVNPVVIDEHTRLNFDLLLPGIGTTAKEFSKQKRLYDQTHDKKYLCRKPCLHDESAMTQIFNYMDKNMKNICVFSPAYIYHGDENSLTAWSQSFDYCFSKQTLSAFRKWLQTQYSDLSALNQEWETSFSQWDEVMPATSDEIKKKSAVTKNYAQWADHRLFMDISLAQFFERADKVVKKYGNDIQSDISGCSPPTAFDGLDWSRFSKNLGKISYYREQSTDEILPFFNDMRSTAWFGYGIKGEYNSYNAWRDAFLFKKAGASFYDACCLLNPDYTIPQATKDFISAVTDLRFGVGRLLESLEIEEPQVLIHFSMNSLRANDLDGRLAEMVDVRDSWIWLCTDLRLPYRFISYDEIENGKLSKTKAKILILSYSVSLSQKETDEIKQFVKKGGLVIGDRMTGIMNEHCRLLKRGRLDDIFNLKEMDTQNTTLENYMVNGHKLGFLPGSAKGVESAQKFFFKGKYGKGSGVFMNTDFSGYSSLRKVSSMYKTAEQYRSILNSLFNEYTIKQEIKLSIEGTWLPVRMFQRYSKKNNEAVFIGLLREPGDRTPVKLRLNFNKNKFCYAIRNESLLGYMNNVPVKLKNAEASLIALMPYAVDAILLDIPNSAKHGDQVEFSIKIKAKGKLIDHPCRLEICSPDGKINWFYSRNLTAKDGKCTETIRFSLNDLPGKWLFRVKDIISGKTVSKEVDLQKKK